MLIFPGADRLGPERPIWGPTATSSGDRDKGTPVRPMEEEHESRQIRLYLLHFFLHGAFANHDCVESSARRGSDARPVCGEVSRSFLVTVDRWIDSQWKARGHSVAILYMYVSNTTVPTSDYLTDLHSSVHRLKISFLLGCEKPKLLLIIFRGSDRARSVRKLGSSFFYVNMIGASTAPSRQLSSVTGVSGVKVSLWRSFEQFLSTKLFHANRIQYVPDHAAPRAVDTI